MMTSTRCDRRKLWKTPPLFAALDCHCHRCW